MVQHQIFHRLIKQDEPEEEIGLVLELQDIINAQFRHVKYRDFFQKLNLVLNLKSLNGIHLLKLILFKIQMRKEIFQFEIEEDMEALIPRELCLDVFPISYRFYDPILVLVQ